jgi:predicted transposase/invertase (TIGR01784 family)
VEKKSHEPSSIHQPHDKLVKKLLSNPATTRDILSLYLPEEVLAIADLNNLELQRDTFIDDEHRAYAVDLLYKTTLHDQEGYIWILLEHQRKSDPWMPVRLFKYIAIIWDHLRKTTKSRLIPLIYPVVIYNGNEPYAHSLNLSDLIEPDTSRKLFGDLFTNPFCLVDLATIPDESLRQSAQTRVKGIALLMALKHVNNRNLQAFFEQTLMKVLKKLDQAGDTDEVVDVLYYLLKESEFLNGEQFWATFHHNFSKEVEGKMTTIAQQIEERGIEKGIMQTAKRLLNEKSSLSEVELIAWVHRMTGLPIEKIKELQKKH